MSTEPPLLPRVQTSHRTHYLVEGEKGSEPQFEHPRLPQEGSSSQGAGSGAVKRTRFTPGTASLGSDCQCMSCHTRGEGGIHLLAPAISSAVVSIQPDIVGFFVI